MSQPENQLELRERREPIIVPPKPRSMQSRFILMEAATVALALFLMAGVLGLSFLIRSRITAEVTALQRRLSMHNQIFIAYDGMLLDFWRAFPPPGPSNSAANYRADTDKIRSLLTQFRQTSTSQDEREEVARIEQKMDSFLAVTDRLLDRAPAKEQITADEKAVMANRENMRNIFQESAGQEFEHLRSANRRLDVYNRALYALLLVLGLYPIGVMIWFRQAQELNLWTPLERLYGMVMEVKRGNLKVKCEIPETVELGTLTAAFLSMSEELADMRDSLEERVRMRAAQLEAANRDLLRAAKLASLGQLVSGVAHEINNPLTSILGFSEVVLSRPGLDANLRGQLQTIRSEAIRLKRLVANLSTFSREAPQNYSNIDLRPVPDRLLQLRSYQLAANNIKIIYDRPDSAVWVNANGEQLIEVMLHLALNAEQAIRSCRDKGEIHVSCETKDGKAILTVKDDGCGMAEGMREQIFDPFFTTKPMGRGTGLGLSISHRIIDQHGGQLSIESAAGCGTSVRISLPLAEGGGAHPAGSDEGTRRQAPPATGKSDPIPTYPFRAEPIHREYPSHASETARILAIDDEAEILSLVSVVLGKTGAEVVTLQDPTRLNSVLDKKHFDAVLCDLKMPGQDGIAVLRWLREKRPELARHFLLMTGNLADADKAVIELEDVPILPKPFSIGRLREMLDLVLAAKR